MRCRTGLLLLAAALAVVGLVLIFTGSPSDVVSFPGDPDWMMGDSDAAYSSTLSLSFDDAVLFSTQSLIGFGLLWASTLLTAGIVGHAIATRRPASPPQPHTPGPMALASAHAASRAVDTRGSMSTQHIVTFSGGVVLTRLPVGRAAGRLWFTFVAAGVQDPEGPGVGAALDHDDWDIDDHVAIEGLDALGGSGGSSGDGIAQMQLEYADAGNDSVVVTYWDAGQMVDREELHLPDL